MSIDERSIEDVFEALRHNSQHGNNSALLIGAGCSYSAGIPDAKGIVKLIEDRFPSAFKRAKTKSYPDCMAALTTGQRRDMIREIISDCTKLNWAHVAIAQLVRGNFVDRILTVNFDPLIPKACAAIGEFPAIYDFVAQHEYSASRAADKAVFFLHGQHTGFAILNTEDEVNKQADRVRPVIADTAHRRTWIVVGYSGDNDPVFSELEALQAFDHALYWVSFGNEDPPPHVQRLLARENTYLIRNYSADQFFVELCQRLQCFPPLFVGSPFSYLKGILESLADFPGGKFDILTSARESVAIAISEYENRNSEFMRGEYKKKAASLAASDLFAKDDLAGLKKLYDESGGKNRTINSLLAQMYVSAGMEILKSINGRSEKEVDQIAQLAINKFRLATEINNDSCDANYAWCTALWQQASRKSDATEADRLYAEAEERVELASNFCGNSDAYYLCMWSSVLILRARNNSCKAKQDLLKQAREKLATAYAINPGLSAYNLACLEAIEGQAQRAVEFLRESKKAGHLRMEEVLAECDFDTIRNSKDFQAFLTDLGAPPN